MPELACIYKNTTGVLKVNVYYLRKALSYAQFINNHCCNTISDLNMCLWLFSHITEYEADFKWSWYTKLFGHFLFTFSDVQQPHRAPRYKYVYHG